MRLELNSWLSVMPLPEVWPHSFPYTIQNPDTGAMERIEGIDDIWRIIESFSKNRFIYSELICDISLLIDPAAQSDLRRYFYSKEWSVSPYPGSYDEQPAVWVDKVGIIQKALAEAQRLKGIRDGNKKR